MARRCVQCAQVGQALSLRDQLLSNRSALVETWFQGIAGTNFTPRPLAEVRERLDKLAGEAVEILTAESFDSQKAHSIGAALAGLHYLNATAAAATVRALGLQLAANLPAEAAAALQPRLIDMLAGIMGGFYAASREAILKEQDEIRDALLVTRQQADAAHEARVLAENSARARSALLGHVVHDLRSPLTSIKGQSDLLAQRLQRERPPIDWLRSRVRLIRASTDRMIGMIGELLDAARLEVGEELELSVEQIHLQPFVRDVVQREVTRRVVRLELLDEPVYAALDPARFERVLHNLLNNAVKFSRKDEVIEVHVRSQDGAPVIEVRDHGRGIPADELPRITTPFYRASTAGGVPGTGLGLAGVKAIVEQHHGTLMIDSTEGAGTSVIIRLPALTG
jgi:two-component system, OmpR family, sensor histidine kinase MprB